MKKPLIVLTGPTASGKTELSVALAQKINGEVISGDSMQVYKHMDIGTAKVTPEEMQNVNHYMIDKFPPDKPCSVATFQKHVKRHMNEIYKNTNIPMLVGGTGFYIRAITHDIEFKQINQDKTIRNELMKEADKFGADHIHDKLRSIDPVSADDIHRNNIQRAVRAIEYYKQTGELMSVHNEKERQRETPYNLLFFALNMDRELLYDRINKRVDQMIKEGLVEEVKLLLDMGYSKELTSMKGIGYKEFFPYFESKLSLDSCIENLKQNTRKYAKRQLTWLRHQANPIWINVDEYDFNKDKILDVLLKHVKKHI